MNRRDIIKGLGAMLAAAAGIGVPRIGEGSGYQQSPSLALIHRLERSVRRRFGMRIDAGTATEAEATAHLEAAREATIRNEGLTLPLALRVKLMRDWRTGLDYYEGDFWATSPEDRR